MLKALCVGAALLAAVVLIDIAYQIISGAQPAFARFGLAFIGHTVWQPNDPFDRFGAGAALYGTAVTSVIALAIGTPLGIAIGLFMALMAGPMTRRFVGPLVEMLAAIPSVIVGFWGVIFLAPFVHTRSSPPFTACSGSRVCSGPPETTGLSLFTAGLVLAFMILPIVASLSRDLFLTVPRELRDGAEALGATRWEVIRGVVLPSHRLGGGGGDDARLRPRARRGDRGDLRDRQRQPDHAIAVESRGYARLADRQRHHLPRVPLPPPLASTTARSSCS